MFIMLSRVDTLTIGNHSWHTTPGAFVFSNPHSSSFHSCVFCLTPFPEQFSWFATSVQRHLQVLTPSFDLRFIMQLFNRTPSHTIVCHCVVILLNLKVVLVKKCAREIINLNLRAEDDEMQLRRKPFVPLYKFGLFVGQSHLLQLYCDLPL
jgi:hypothetical protein